jgi:hypothetical protein
VTDNWEKSIRKFYEAIDEIVGADGSWQRKRDAMLAAATEDDNTNLIEITSWFEHGDEW